MRANRYTPLNDRLWGRVEFTNTCWLWDGVLSSGGYGHVSINGKLKMVHRLAYEFCVGPIPDGLQLDHLCRVRHCMNPDHLEVVTNRENILRGEGLAAINARKTHCKRGHEFDGVDSFINSEGGRVCRICRRAGERRRASVGA